MNFKIIVIGVEEDVLKSSNRALMYIITNFPNQVKYIFDSGKTQIEPNSLTVVVFAPMKDCEIPYDIKLHKLL